MNRKEYKKLKSELENVELGVAYKKSHIPKISFHSCEDMDCQANQKFLKEKEEPSADWQEEFYRVYQNIGGDSFTSKEDRLIEFISDLLVAERAFLVERIEGEKMEVPNYERFNQTTESERAKLHMIIGFNQALDEVLTLLKDLK